MATRTTLKGYFETGDTPTQAQFESLIESCPNITDDYSGIEEKFYTKDIVVSGVEQNITIVPADAASWFIMSDAWIMPISLTGGSSGDQVDIYYNGVDQNVFGTFGTPFLGVGYLYRSQVGISGSISGLFSLDYDLIIKCPDLPAGISACTIKVIVKGFKIAK